MLSRWALIVADFRREYHLSGGDLAGLSASEFTWLLSGLSERARFVQAWAEAPKHLHDPDEIAAITAAARR